MNTKILNIYDEVFTSNTDFSNTIVEKHISKIKELDEFLPPSLSFFIVTNTAQNSFPFVSKNFEYNLGLDSELMKTMGVPYWMSHFHPEELELWVHILQDLMIYTMTEVAPKKRLRLSYTWNFRIKKADGNYVNLFEHQVPVLVDENYKPVIGIGHLTMIGEGEPMPLKATVKFLNENNEYETLLNKNYSQKLLTDGLTNRENDIIRYLALKKSSKEIAGILGISSHTVDTHRRNILKKLNINSTGELTGYVKTHQLY
ncbi:LuxR C-terminal-related transcriptional regulator [Flavobacterium ovatum]|uniref:LuxR C-terminal-related transcriptional regulator n=1 Tax=Flavobacterium ovatum TaxID=1928857 RepID=UPI00344CFA01